MTSAICFDKILSLRPYKFKKYIISNSKGYIYLGTFTVLVLTCVCIQSRSFVLESHACCYSSQPFCQQSPFLCYLYCIRQFSLHACILYVSETCLMLVWCQREEEKKWILTLCVPFSFKVLVEGRRFFFPDTYYLKRTSWGFFRGC